MNKRYMARLRKTFVFCHGDSILIMLPEIMIFFSVSDLYLFILRALLKYSLKATEVYPL